MSSTRTVTKPNYLLTKRLSTNMKLNNNSKKGKGTAHPLNTHSEKIEQMEGEMERETEYNMDTDSD